METKLIDFLMNIGAFGAISVLLWQRLIKMTDMYVSEIKELAKTHKTEMVSLEDRYEKDRDLREERYAELTEKAIETMTRVELMTSGIIKLLNLREIYDIAETPIDESKTHTLQS
jgi:hypothetical protein